MALTTLNRKTSIITTSWDDGHHSDIRLAKLLKSYNVYATFYVPCRSKDFEVIKKDDILFIRNLGMEIGAHTVSHKELNHLSYEEAYYEITESKVYLEKIIGESVYSFCYPRGKANKQLSTMVKDAGFKLARTIVPFRPGNKFNPYLMPTSFQFYPLPRIKHLKRRIQEYNFIGLINWCRFFNCHWNPIKLAKSTFDYICNYGGVMHIWGHSWELDKYNLWSALEEVLGYISNRQGVHYLNNEQTIDFQGRLNR
jgi:peptidoglycan-N-acetylglucosamine deacetylase